MSFREKNQSSPLAIKTLDYAMSGPGGGAVCEGFIEALGLKTLFAALMGKNNKKSKSAAPASTTETTHILGVISSLFSNIESESTSRLRLLAKFVEANYEKVDKLLEIRDSAKARLASTEAEIEKEKKVCFPSFFPLFSTCSLGL
jgi:beta-catenin-like protein 1